MSLKKRVIISYVRIVTAVSHDFLYVLNTTTWFKKKKERERKNLIFKTELRQLPKLRWLIKEELFLCCADPPPPGHVQLFSTKLVKKQSMERWKTL